MTNQLDLANQVMGLFHEMPAVRHVFLRGSLSTGVFDEMSDVDIGIDVSGSDNAEFAQTIIAVMQEKLDLDFYDWATSLLPEQYVIGFHVKGMSLFWYIDIECSATPHFPTLTRERVANDPLAHLIKLWVIHAKYVLRGSPHPNLGRFLGRVLEGDLQEIAPEQLLRLALGRLTAQSNGRFANLLGQCRQLSGSRF